MDRLIVEIDRALRTVLAPAPTVRPRPGAATAEASLDAGQRRHAAALMRVNHVGEVCAQALYRGQALTCANPRIRTSLAAAAAEETEHLNWTAARIDELGGRKSLLNPLWYAGALTIGAVAGRCGDRWNLGFLAETERQVGCHLRGHLDRLPQTDAKSREIVTQMMADEAAHARTAEALGAAELPVAAKAAMRLAAKAMTTTAYWL